MTEQPGFYSILPAVVRYDTRLTDSEKIFFSEITALSNKYGYCTASNGYFSRLYDVTKVTVSRRISHLKELNHIHVEIVREGKEIKQRKIFPITNISTPINTNDNTPINNSVGSPINTNVKENNTRENITSINRDATTKIFDYINKNLEMVQSPLKVEELEYEINLIKNDAYEIVKIAVDYSKKNNKGINYLIKVIKNWNKEDINTIEKAKAKVIPKQRKQPKNDTEGLLENKRKEIYGG
ncbi:DnaD domain protein [Staphylococcus nepalensis]|uniref:DnaD domain protein n=1 Tax=Staphylococcus nepalensis TaxID=214473 RepID=UPI000DFC01ED|nr:DnaD domain protein [Staphylococcus nepalensis]SUM69865.1 DnaD domain protein [Staphylococcus nepalensis]SUM96086.1 DnaD domain protein [Staphylococcus nepalensis]